MDLGTVFHSRIFLGASRAATLETTLETPGRSNPTVKTLAENAREALSLYLEEARDPKLTSGTFQNPRPARAGVMFGSARLWTLLSRS